jgi:hypothetical protein
VDIVGQKMEVQIQACGLRTDRQATDGRQPIPSIPPTYGGQSVSA